MSKIGKILTLSTILALPIACSMENSNRDLQRRLKSLDQGMTIEFNSVSACIGKGFSQIACLASEKEANSIAEAFRTSVNYGAVSDCTSKHSSCNRKEDMIPVTIYNMPIKTRASFTYYSPQVVGWQAGATDLSNSVPLYHGQTNGVAVRSDGKEFKLEY